MRKYAKMGSMASPVESMNPDKLRCFTSPIFMCPINPFCISTPLQFTASNTTGHRSPCRVHLPGAYISPTSYNEMLLPELDFLVAGTTGRVNKLHIVFGNEDPTLEFLKELKVSMTHLEKRFGSDTDKLVACEAWHMSKRFMLTISALSSFSSLYLQILPLFSPNSRASPSS
ncbi:unnamed protein product [Allacma fusca]|uniref:Uncharacterized protein n=2 Tax=Allacma fusca TaxID=39272 RepID=A0A8J2J211_9HEXA|nr:unnamed protein product [Allacma fusca]